MSVVSVLKKCFLQVFPALSESPSRSGWLYEKKDLSCDTLSDENVKIHVDAIVTEKGIAGAVDSIQVLVFNQKGQRIGYGRHEGSHEKLQVPSVIGQVTIWVFANVQDLSAIGSLDVLNLARFSFGNAFGRVPMAGSIHVTVKEAGLVYRIPLRRLVAKISLEHISNRTDIRLNIVSVYILNAAGDIGLPRSREDDPSVWFNRMRLEPECSLEGMTHVNVGKVIASGEELRLGCDLYSFPNAYPPRRGGSWSPRRSRIVVKVEQPDGTVFYYPVLLPKLESGKTYCIEKLRIMRVKAECEKNSSEQEAPMREEMLRVNLKWKKVII